MKWFLVWMGVLSAPVMAQDLCPGTWMGDAPEASDPGAGALVVRTVIPAGQGYAGQFRLGEAQDVRIEAKGGFGGDPMAEVYDAQGALVASDDDGGGDLSVRTVVGLPAGDYCLVVRGATGGLLPVEMQVSLPDQPSLLPSSPGCADLPDRLAAGVGDTLDGVPVSDPVALDLQLDGAVRLRAAGRASDALLELYDDAGELIAQSDDADGLHAQIDTDPLPAGSYCAIVRTYEADGSPVDVSVLPLDPDTLTRDRVDAGEISPLPGSDHPVIDLGGLEGRIVRELPVQGAMTWMRVQLDTPGLVLMDALAIGETDPRLVLFDEAGRSFGSNDDVGAGDLSSRLAVPLMPGAYLIGLGEVDGNAGMVRLVIDLYLRVE